MPEETRRHLDYLDGWRGVAVALVLAGHFGLDEVRPGVSVMGVDFFFVLSGRLMAEILFVQRAHLPTFFFKRFSRVYPGLLFFVVGAGLIFAATPYRNGLLAAVTALTFTINYAMIYAHPVALLDHLWSLCVEEHAYVLLAGIALLARRRLIPAGLVVMAAGVAGLANGVVRTDLLHEGTFDVLWRSDVQVAPIFLGGAFYLAFRRIEAHDVSPWIAPLALAAGIGAKLWGPNALVAFGLAIPLLAVAVNTIDVTFSQLRRLFELPAARYIGVLSYSVYLWQQPFYKLSRDHPQWTPLLLVAGIVTGAASFYLIERPSRTALNAMWQARMPAGRKTAPGATSRPLQNTRQDPNL